MALGQRIYELTALLRLTRSRKRDQEQLTERELLLLNLLRFVNRPIAVTAIQERLDVPKAMVSGYIKKLEQKEFIVRSDDAKDRRIRLYELTEKGRQFVGSLRKARGRAYDSTMKSLLKFDPDQLASIEKILDAAFAILPPHLMKIMEERLRVLNEPSEDEPSET